MTKEFVRKVMSWDWTKQPIPMPASKKINKLPPMVGPVLDIPPHPTFALPETGFEWLEMPTGSVTQNAVDAADGQGSELDTECTTGKCPSCEIVTAEMLKKVFPEAPMDRLSAVAKETNLYINRAHLDNEFRLTHFFGQVRQEVGPKMLFREEYERYTVGNYTSLWPRLKGKETEIKELIDQKDYYTLMEDYAYGKDTSTGKILGNDTVGDGFKFIGRGLKQTTGRWNYGDLTRTYKKNWGGSLDFEDNPELVETMPYAARAAFVFWMNKSAYLDADKGITRSACDAITRKVNKNTDSYAQRWAHVNRIWEKRVFKDVCFNTSEQLSNKQAEEPK